MQRHRCGKAESEVCGEQSKEGPKGRGRGWRLAEGPKLGQPRTPPTPWTALAGDGTQPPGAREMWVSLGEGQAEGHDLPGPMAFEAELLPSTQSPTAGDTTRLPRAKPAPGTSDSELV